MQFDLVINNATLVEPSSDLLTLANIGIKDEKVAVVTRGELEGQKVIDADLKVVCPGFIDIHSHVDNYQYGGMLYAMQGITTTVGGNCGLSPVGPKQFFQEMSETGFPINQGQLVGHSFSMRTEAGLTDVYAPASADQIEAMTRRLEKGLEEGALGLSLGLEYAPGSSFEEIRELSKIAALYNKPVAIHTRYDSWRGLEAIHEVIRLGRETGASIQVAHLAYMVGMGMMTEALNMIADARREGLDITADSGLYSAFATFIGSAVFDPGCLEKWGIDYSDFYVSTGPFAGRQCDQPLFEKLRQDEPDTVIVAFAGRDSEVLEALSAYFVMVSTDGCVGSPEPGSGHPQDSGTYPRFFRLMVRETGILTLLQAVKKCTLLPAQRLGLTDKGHLRPGADADLVIFDLKEIRDNSDYPGLGKPDAPPSGIDYVIVNGAPVVEKGVFVQDSKPGKPVTLPNKIWEL